MGDQLFTRIQHFLAAHNLARPAALIVVAVSGGPDSLCLLHLLQRLHAAGGPRLHVAHLDHSFRGAESAAEAAFVRDTAVAWAIPATIERQDVATYARRLRRNRQAAARELRYRFLAATARQMGAAAVAVAHQADDQAETVLLHLLRGAGSAGLRGMRPVVPWEEWAPDNRMEANLSACRLIRPLLTTSRAEIENYCKIYGLEPRQDPSNRSPAYARGRLRGDLLPALQRYNPQVVDALSRTATICADDYAFIQSRLDALWPELARVNPGRVQLDLAQWVRLPATLQRYSLRRAAALLIGRDDLRYERVEAGRTAAVRGSVCEIGFGLRLAVMGEALLISYGTELADSLAAAPQLSGEELALKVPGETMLGKGWLLRVEESDAADSGDGRSSIVLDCDALDGPLLLRRRRPGDRFRPAGGQGSRLVQDFFVDQKVPRELRTAWPLLATPASIVWIVGLRADARFQAGEATRRRLVLRLEGNGIEFSG